MPRSSLRISTLCNFYIALVLDGLQRLSGLFVLELLQLSTGISRQNASTPFIFSWVASNIIASFSGILTGNKKSGIAILLGVLLTATGAALCISATNITTLTVFWGLVFGSGHGLASPHLSKRLKNENATKLSFLLHASPCIGIAIMPFVFDLLNSNYGLRGSCLMFCGIILNYLPLALAAAYDIEIRIPTIKWRVRKKSNQYTVTKEHGCKAISIDSFTDSLEPDAILKIRQNDEPKDETMQNEPESPTSDEADSDPDFIRIPPIGRKRSETRGRDLQGLDTRFLPRNITQSQIAVEIQTYEKGRTVFEGSFNNEDIVPNDTEHTKDDNVNCDITNSIKVLENILNTRTESDLNLKNKVLPKISENETESLSENCMVSNHDLAYTCIVPEIVIENIDSDKETEKEISPKTNQKEKESLQLSPKLNKSKFNAPLDIKVHVEEYVFKNADDDWDESFNKYLGVKQDSYSNIKNTDFTSQDFSKNHLKLQNPKVSKIYSISEFSDSNVITSKTAKKSNTIKQTLKYLNQIWSRACLCLLLLKIIFEINLVTLLAMFADFGSEVDDVTLDFKWILVAFGAGGIIGKICSCKMSSTIPEKCHSIGVVLFLLIGLSTAGVLYSPDLSWLAGFYCIIGALEGGITYVIPKFIMEYTEKDIHSTLASVMSFLSGISLICIPYVIGLFRDEQGDYEFLLQILSCSSVLCAFMVYSLPFLKTTSNKHKNIFRKNLEVA